MSKNPDRPGATTNASTAPGVVPSSKDEQLALTVPDAIRHERSRAAVQALSSSDVATRKAAQAALENLGAIALPDLIEVLEHTRNFDCYLRARYTIESIRQRLPGQSRQAPFHIAYCRHRALALIAELDSTKAVDRQRAVDKLIAMGADVLPELGAARKLALTDTPKNIRMAFYARNAIRGIEKMSRMTTKPTMARHPEQTSVSA